MTLTDDGLAEIRARADAATSGPWVWWGDSLVVTAADHLGVLMAEPRTADAEFIAHAREDVPALLAEVDRLRALAPDAVCTCGHERRWHCADGLPGVVEFCVAEVAEGRGFGGGDTCCCAEFVQEQDDAVQQSGRNGTG